MASNGKVALVTGGGSGIGKASALALAREGFALVVAGRRPEPLQAVVGEIESMQGKALAVPTDVGDPASVEALFAEDQGEFRPARRAVQQCRVRRRRADRGSRMVALEGGDRLDRPRHVPVHAAGLPHHEGPDADGRPDHQQRLDLGACAAAVLDRLHDREARRHRPDEIDLARRPPLRHLVRPDRCRQRPDRDDAAHDPGRAAAQRRNHGRADDGCRKRRPLGRADGDRDARRPTSSS